MPVGSDIIDRHIIKEEGVIVPEGRIRSRIHAKRLRCSIATEVRDSPVPAASVEGGIYYGKVCNPGAEIGLIVLDRLEAMGSRTPPRDELVAPCVASLLRSCGLLLQSE